MKTKIGIISDLHATPSPVEEALAIFNQQGVKQVFCAGDIAGYGEALDETVNLLVANGCVSVAGNHEAWYVQQTSRDTGSVTYDYLINLPTHLEQNFEGMALYMVHASPPCSLIKGVRLLDECGEPIDEQLDYWGKRLQGEPYDVLVVGHTHQAFAEQLGNTLVLNPGSTLFNHSCAVLSFPELEVEWFALSGQALLKSWNWSDNFRG